jgi:hypothetical protein
MFPTVALPPQFHPHHRLGHRLQYDPLSHPYDLTSATLPRRDENRTTFSSIPRSRLQFPHPVQRSDSRGMGSNDPHKAKVGEHALRRKTPNGTLAAGYDGTPGDPAIQPPAAKHILVSSLESGQVLPSTLSVENWPQGTFDQTPSAQYQGFPPVFKQDPGRTNNGLSTDPIQGGAGSGPSWVRSLNFQPGMDSVLHQTLPSPRYYLHNGPTIPTVLPANLQPCLGPTAPVGTGPYGPYWPDGAYIPYRPAALRDSRFLSLPFANDQSTPQLYDLHSFGPTSLPASGLPTSAGLPWNQSRNHDMFLQLQQQQNSPSRHSHQKSLSTFNDHQHTLPYHIRSASTLSTGVPSTPGESWSGSHASRNVSLSASEATSRTQNAEFKEKVLSWAHGVYVDLLAALHHARRQSGSKTNADGQPQRLSKPSIYPKPPRQPGLDFSSSSHPDMPRHNSYPSSRFDLHSQNPPRQMDPFNASSHLPANPQSERPIHHGLNHQQLDEFGTVRRASGTALARFAGPFHNDGSTMVSAASALEMLSHLCMESGWEWIDGMLLGGCLAYGLGDYHKAMRWYSRIIARDAT